MSTVPHAGSAALRSCWHPVVYAAEVWGAPRAAMLLGEPLVLWRDSKGAPHALRDVHLSFDAVAVAYRRAMRAHGFS